MTMFIHILLQFLFLLGIRMIQVSTSNSMHRTLAICHYLSCARLLHHKNEGKNNQSIYPFTMLDIDPIPGLSV